jgi:hypothetical protein
MADYTLELAGAAIDAALVQAPKSRGLFSQTSQTLIRGTNISSITDAAQGQSNMSFTTNFDAVTYSHTACGSTANGGISTLFFYLKTTSSVRGYCWRVDSPTYADTPDFGFSIRGDLV